MESFITIFLIIIMLVLLVSTKIAPDFIFFGTLTSLMLFPVFKDGKLTIGVINIQEGLSGFSNPGLITVAFLFMVSCGLQQTGAIDWIGEVFFGRPKKVRTALMRIFFPVMALSAFLNNTPIVAMLTPVIANLGKKIKISPSKLLMPMCHATTLGGMITLIGTSTNIVVNGLLISEAKIPSLKLFDITWVGLPCAIIGVLFLIIFAPILLKDRVSVIKQFENPREYTIELIVPKSSNLIGKTIQEAGLRNLPYVYLAEIIRDDEIIPAVDPGQHLKENDRLLFIGMVDSIKELQNLRGLTPATNQLFKLNSPRYWRQLYEVVISNTSPLIGKTIKEAKFRTYYNAVVIAVARNNERIRKKIGEITIQPGDVLLIEATNSFLERYKDSRDFFLVSPIADSTPKNHERAPIAIGILSVMVLLAMFNILDMLLAAMFASILMIITRCCTISQARKSLDVSVLFIIAASLGIGKAIESSGLADLLASFITNMSHGDLFLSLLAVYVATCILTELLTNNAAVALIFPIMLEVSSRLNVDVIPFAIAVMIAGSAGFATPFGYQTNLMVYGPGGYKFTDYVKIGIPLDIIVGVVAVVLIYMRYFFSFAP